MILATGPPGAAGGAPYSPGCSSLKTPLGRMRFPYSSTGRPPTRPPQTGRFSGRFGPDRARNVPPGQSRARSAVSVSNRSFRVELQSSPNPGRPRRKLRRRPCRGGELTALNDLGRSRMPVALRRRSFNFHDSEPVGTSADRPLDADPHWTRAARARARLFPASDAERRCVRLHWSAQIGQSASGTDRTDTSRETRIHP